MSKPKPNNQKPAQTTGPVLSSNIKLIFRTWTRWCESSKKCERYIIIIIQSKSRYM